MMEILVWEIAANGFGRDFTGRPFGHLKKSHTPAEVATGHPARSNVTHPKNS